MTYTYRQDKTQFSIGKEGTYGTAGVGSIWPGHVQDHSPDWNINITPKRYVGSNNRTVDDFYEGVHDIRGRFEVIPQDWRLLEFAFGKNTDSGGPVYIHTIVESGALPSSTQMFLRAMMTSTGRTSCGQRSEQV